jgi:hypothetical protein
VRLCAVRLSYTLPFGKALGRTPCSVQAYLRLRNEKGILGRLREECEGLHLLYAQILEIASEKELMGEVAFTSFWTITC